MFIPPFIVEHTKDHARCEFATINDALNFIEQNYEVGKYSLLDSKGKSYNLDYPSEDPNEVWSNLEFSYNDMVLLPDGKTGIIDAFYLFHDKYSSGETIGFRVWSDSISDQRLKRVSFAQREWSELNAIFCFDGPADALRHIKILRHKNRITVPFSNEQLDKIRKYINETDLKIKEATSKYSHELRCPKDKEQSLKPNTDALICKICGYKKYYVSAWIIENNK